MHFSFNSLEFSVDLGMWQPGICLSELGWSVWRLKAQGHWCRRATSRWKRTQKVCLGREVSDSTIVRVPLSPGDPLILPSPFPYALCWAAQTQVLGFQVHCGWFCWSGIVPHQILNNISGKEFELKAPAYFENESPLPRKWWPCFLRGGIRSAGPRLRGRWILPWCLGLFSITLYWGSFMLFLSFKTTKNELTPKKWLDHENGILLGPCGYLLHWILCFTCHQSCWVTVLTNLQCHCFCNNVDSDCHFAFIRLLLGRGMNWTTFCF